MERPDHLDAGLAAVAYSTEGIDPHLRVALHHDAAGAGVDELDAHPVGAIPDRRRATGGRSAASAPANRNDISGSARPCGRFPGGLLRLI
jgi:hypothetical protein